MNSEFVISTTENFAKCVRKLSKKHTSLINDLLKLREKSYADPQAGISMGRGCYKVRMVISSKNSGKSGGARVITYVKVQAKRITLLDIYHKSEKENITDAELAALLKKAEE